MKPEKALPDWICHISLSRADGHYQAQCLQASNDHKATSYRWWVFFTTEGDATRRQVIWTKSKQNNWSPWGMEMFCSMHLHWNHHMSCTAPTWGQATGNIQFEMGISSELAIVHTRNFKCFTCLSSHFLVALHVVMWMLVLWSTRNVQDSDWVQTL